MLFLMMQMPFVENLYCKYQYEYTTDWKFLQGLDNGMSQIARVSSSNHDFIWNYPIEVTFKSQSPHGWPKLVVTCYTINMWGNDVVQGYGWIHLPTTPGTFDICLFFYLVDTRAMCVYMLLSHLLAVRN